MKKSRLIILLIFLNIFLFFVINYANSMKITGEVSSADTNISILINNGAPSIYLTQPKENRTYRNYSIPLNYSITEPEGISLVFYNIDGTNISLGNETSDFLYISSSEGYKTLILYANDTLSLINSTNISFFVNNTKLIILYENFRGSTKGSSTDFDSFSEAELENLSDMTLENTNFGKISWNEIINLTADIDASDEITGLDSNVIILNSSIFVNTTELPNLNKRATLWFYNLTFTNPRVLRDGTLCPSSICTNQTYTSGTLRVDVNEFSNYSVEETPESPETPGGGGSGGVAGNETKKIAYYFYPDMVKLQMLQGEKTIETIKIENFDTKEIFFNLKSDSEIVKLSEENFSIQPEGEKEITLYISVPKEIIPEIYIYNILITIKKDNEILTDKIAVIMAISEEKRLFDLKLKILPEYRNIKAGEDIIAETSIDNLGVTKGRVDVDLRYTLRDIENNIIKEEIKSVAIETKFSEIIRISVPKGTKPGRYILAADVTYSNKKAYTMDNFFIIETTKERPSSFNLFYFLIILIAAILLILSWRYYLKSKRAESTARRSFISKMETKTKHKD